MSLAARISERHFCRQHLRFYMSSHKRLYLRKQRVLCHAYSFIYYMISFFRSADAMRILDIVVAAMQVVILLLYVIMLMRGDKTAISVERDLELNRQKQRMKDVKAMTMKSRCTSGAHPVQIWCSFWKAYVGKLTQSPKTTYERRDDDENQVHIGESIRWKKDLVSKSNVCKTLRR